MFSGIVEAVGRVVEVDVTEAGGRLVIDPGDLEPGALGDSIAVNGVCLTVERLDGRRFQVTTVPETLRRTNLGRLRAGDRVNLERSLPAGGRLGGHIVQGHVDGTIELVAKAPDGDSLRLRYAAPEHGRYIVEKGFVAVDGVSLTVTNVEGDTFGIALIPYTRAHTILDQPVGYRANLEVDILAKYVERLLHASGYDRSSA